MAYRGEGYRLGAVSEIRAEAIGVPGKRRFRLVVDAGSARAVVWLEKEQLFELAVYLKETAESLPERVGSRPSSPPEPTWQGGEERIEFTAGRLAVGHDASSNSFLVMAYDAESVEALEGREDVPVTLTFWVDLERARALAEQALKVVAAGRPRCPVCGGPIDPDGHVCPRSNGHFSAESLPT